MLSFLEQIAAFLFETFIQWLFFSIQEEGIEIAAVADNVLNENEEKNWTVLQEQKRGPFREKVTIFFEDYPEEDLLAFVEDTVELDDDSPITAVGREVIFIAAKSIIDTVLL